MKMNLLNKISPLSGS